MNFTNRSKMIRTLTLLTLLLIGIVVMLNFIAARHFLRFDLTSSREFTIHPASREILKELDDIVTVKVFFSSELPPNLMAVRQYVEDLLDEFNFYAKGNLNIQFLDPSEETVAEHAKQLGIPAIRMNILSKDKFEVKNGFLGLALMYGNDHEVLPVIEATPNLEYDLIAALRKLTNAELKRVGFVTGHNEYPIIARGEVSGGEGYVLANAALTKNYFVQPVDLKKPEDLKGIDTLVIGGPEIPFSDSEKVALDQYLMKGGSLVFLMDALDVVDFFQAKPLPVNLNDLLEHYGARVESALMLDALRETVSFSEGLLEFSAPYPFWIKAVRDYFDPGNPMLRQLGALVFPWPSPLVIKPAEGVEATTLIRTSPDAWLQTNSFDLNPDIETPSVTSQYPLAVLLEGTFKSFYSSRKKLPSDFVETSNGQGRALVIGNSRFLTDRMVETYKQNLTFFLNAIDYLTLDQSLISIRSRGVAERPLLRLSDSERQVIKWGGTLLMPFLVFLAGVLKALERRPKKVKL